MEGWRSEGIVIQARAHADHAAIVTLMTEDYGRHLGYVQGGMSSKKKANLELGNLVSATWSARTSDNMGAYSIEVIENNSVPLLDHFPKLLALQSACALLNQTLAEREGHPGLYHGTLALLHALNTDVWAESYIMWELALLKELGFGLDLTKCGGGGSSNDLYYISPKTARAVSKEKGAPYADKLLSLPQFLMGKEDTDSDQAICDGLKIGAYFLEHRVLAHTNYTSLPEPRMALYQHFLSE